MSTMPHITVQLVHIQGPLKGEIQELADSEIRIGRHPDCQVSFPKEQTTLSRVHARIVREGNRFKVIDQSTNGTYVNGQRISEIFLKDGDVVMFAEGGPKVSFLTQTGKASPALTSPPQPTQRAVSAAPTPRKPAPRIDSPPATPAPFPPADRPAASAPPVHAPQQAPSVPVETVKAPLAIQYGPALKSFHTLPIVIGSGPGCDFPINHSALSDRHAQIFFASNQYWIKDLTGMNNIMINGQAIHNQAPLEPDMQLALSSQGPKFRFIGGGRLAQIEDPLPESPEPPSRPVPPSAPQPGEKPGSLGQKAGTLFKKFFS